MVPDIFILFVQKVNKDKKRREIKNKKNVMNHVCYSEMCPYDYFTSYHIFLYNIFFFIFIKPFRRMYIWLSNNEKIYLNTYEFVIFCFVYSLSRYMLITLADQVTSIQ